MRRTLWRDGKLLATFRDGRAHLNAYLDDHAFLLAALLEMLQAQFQSADLDFAVALGDALLQRFEDPAQGGFFFTSHDHERLILRLRSVHDNATPSGNGVAIAALLRLGHLTGDMRYLDAAERAARAFQVQLTNNPSACPSLLIALDEWLTPPSVIVVRGEPAELPAWTRALPAARDPARMVLAVPARTDGLPPALDKPWTGGGVNAWVCRGVTCSTPVSEVSGLLALLGEST